MKFYNKSDIIEFFMFYTSSVGRSLLGISRVVGTCLSQLVQHAPVVQ